MIELTFLGTGQAVPTAKRNHTSILLKRDAETILIDCGEGTQRQMRIADINPCKLTRILITHWHGDHVLGLPGLLQTLALNGYNKTLHIYGPRGTKKFLNLLLNIFIFVNKIKIEINEIDREGIFIEEKDFLISAYRLKHSTICLGYVFEEKDKRRIDVGKIKQFKLPGPLIGELQKGKDVSYNGKKIKASDVTYLQKGKKIAFMLDTALCPECFKIADGADLLVSEATYSSELEEKASEYQHLVAEQAAEIAKKSKVKKLILTHLSQRYEKDDASILKEAKKIFNAVEIAKDFMKVKI